VEYRSKGKHEKKLYHGRQDGKYFYDFTLFQKEFCGIRAEVESSSMTVLKQQKWSLAV
jgi:hypothetical protein